MSLILYIEVFKEHEPSSLDHFCYGDQLCRLLKKNFVDTSGGNLAIVPPQRMNGKDSNDAQLIALLEACQTMGKMKEIYRLNIDWD